MLELTKTQGIILSALTSFGYDFDNDFSTIFTREEAEEISSKISNFVKTFKDDNELFEEYKRVFQKYVKNLMGEY